VITALPPIGARVRYGGPTVFQRGSWLRIGELGTVTEHFAADPESNPRGAALVDFGGGRRRVVRPHLPNEHEIVDEALGPRTRLPAPELGEVLTPYRQVGAALQHQKVEQLRALVQLRQALYPAAVAIVAEVADLVEIQREADAARMALRLAGVSAELYATTRAILRGVTPAPRRSAAAAPRGRKARGALVGRAPEELAPHHLVISGTESAYDAFGPHDTLSCANCGAAIKYAWVTECGPVGGDCLATLTGDASTRRDITRALATITRELSWRRYDRLEVNGTCIHGYFQPEPDASPRARDWKVLACLKTPEIARLTAALAAEQLDVRVSGLGPDHGTA
jgi:hypothetical protein